jgi:hypothetical protein
MKKEKRKVSTPRIPMIKPKVKSKKTTTLLTTICSKKMITKMELILR